jgi:uncharacterized protein (TIGR03790 family)
VHPAASGFRRGTTRFWLPLICGVIPAQAALEPSQVLILVNKDQAISSRVASMYEKLRGVPSENLLRLALGQERNLTPEQYWTRAGGPVKAYLETHPQVRCIVTTSGVPYTVQASNGQDEGAAFDNELAAVLRENSAEPKRRQPNPLFLGGWNPYGVTDPRTLRMIYVSRLDGPNLETITRMVEDAIAVEKTGLSGPVFGDAQGLDAITGYGLGDFSIRSAIDRLSGAGFRAQLDLLPASWKQPQGTVGNQAEGAAFYIGWYDLLNFQDIFGKQGLARGSIAWHIASQEAQNIWDENGKGWCVNLMRRGAAITLGPVREPYVTAFPHGDIFVEGLLTGGTVAESYWLALPEVSWAMVLLGDPLYRPFAGKPRPALVAQAYAAANATGVLEKGQTSPLLVQIGCVGPAGSSTGPLTGKAEPEMGLAAASGPVTIPPLKAGETAVIRIPSVTAGNDETGLFRLRLDVQDANGLPRRIPVEGRTGFSRLSAGLSPKSQMFVSPDGAVVFWGLPGRTAFVETATLRSGAIHPPQGFAITGAEFSPDGKHVALALYEPQQKNSSVILAGSDLKDVQALPAGMQFLRWLEPNRILLKSSDRLVIHSITGSEDQSFDASHSLAGNVIPGTNVVLLTTEDKKFGFKKGAEPFQEVLQGVSLSSWGAAAANDLSLFGAVDVDRRLWVQHGVHQKPEIIAEGVEQVLWGSVSHRVLVEGKDKKSRIYDGRDGSWTDLGTVTLAAWSHDEERLLYLEQTGPTEAWLSLLIGRQTHRLCPISRIGALAGMAFTAKGDRAFLLAGLSGQFNVWMMALPSAQ